MSIKDFIEKEKKITVFQLLVGAGILIVIVIAGVFTYSKINNNNVNKAVDKAAVEAIPLIVEVDTDSDVNTTILKVLRDWNDNNKDSLIKVSSEKINDCYIVEAVHEEGNKALSKDGDCSNLTTGTGLNTSGNIETINGDTDLHIDNSIIISGDSFVSNSNVDVILIAPNEREVSIEAMSDALGAVEVEFLIPDDREYVGVWSYSIRGENNTFDIESSFIVEQ